MCDYYPQDPSCGGSKVEDDICVLYPEDPSCGGSQNQNDFCSYYPEDPSCGGNQQEDPNNNNDIIDEWGYLREDKNDQNFWDYYYYYGQDSWGSNDSFDRGNGGEFSY